MIGDKYFFCPLSLNSVISGIPFVIGINRTKAAFKQVRLDRTLSAAIAVVFVPAFTDYAK